MSGADETSSFLLSRRSAVRMAASGVAVLAAPRAGSAAGTVAGAADGMEGLPAYVPQHKVGGTIRTYGFAFGGVIEAWQRAFRALHPEARFENTLPTSDAAFPALVTRVADLAPNGGEPALTEALSFFETHGYHASYVIVGTGAFDQPGKSNGPVVFVHKDNPLHRLTIDQLDGIFGSERTGGMRGFEWTPSDGRGADKNIRRWGELGLTGAWADKPIQTYGHAPSGASRFFQLRVLKNSDKWNPNYRGYVETGTKMIAPEDRATQRLGVQHMLREELAKDRYGIAWTIMSQAAGIDGIKPLALAARGSNDHVVPSRDTFQQRRYPLARDIFLYFDRAPGAPLEPKLKEFLRFALSRDGQRMVGEAGYLPLPAATMREQLQKLE
jgi:phosphate transport system substrate-binding protein